MHPTESQSVPKVLIVDDRQENLLALEVALRPLRCDVIKATSGDEAISILGRTKVAAIILDVQMPVMDGFMAAEKIRDNPETAVTPIILISAFSIDNEIIEKAYASGATALLSKPLNTKILEGKIQFFIDLFERIESNDQRNIEARLAAELEKSKLIESSLDAVVGAGADERILYWNHQAEITFGWSKEEALGQLMAELIIPERYREAHRKGMQRFLSTGVSKIQNQRLEVPAIKKSGEEIMVELTVTSMKSADGSWRFYSFLRDISERVQAREAIKIAKDQAEAAKEEAQKANRLKSFYLASMSHEIRTPLGAMLGFAELLREPTLSQAQRNNYLEILIRNGESLSMIINDILDLSKVEAGKMGLEYKTFSIESLLAEVMSLMAVKAKEKKLALDFLIDPDCKDEITTDSLRTRQVLLNLVSNAIKFTAFGHVRVIASCINDEGNRYVSFDVVDSGIGIAKPDQERIFEAFAQAEESTTRQFGGTGLGLALSRRLASGLGGGLVLVNSAEGKGSTFRFTIRDQLNRVKSTPAAKTSALSPKLDNRSLEGIRVLVVDDSPDNQLLIWQYLKKHGAITETADNGVIGQRKALSGNYDIVLMDIQMPEMDDTVDRRCWNTLG